MGNYSGSATKYEQEENIPDDNGIRFLGKILPDEILYHILSFVPPRDLVRSVTLVCQYWSDLLLDHHFWFKKLQIEGIMLSENTRARISAERDKAKIVRMLRVLTCSHLPFNQNLIKNPSGADGLKHWVIRHGGDGLIVESKPVGSDPIPEEAGQHCFVTSYGLCSRKQDIDLRALGFTKWIMQMLQPQIVVSEWVSARWDCGSKSRVCVELQSKGSSKDITLEWSSDDEDVLLRKWYKLEEVVTDYPADLVLISYSNSGWDSQYWAGHYGAKTAGSSVRLVI